MIGLSSRSTPSRSLVSVRRKTNAPLGVPWAWLEGSGGGTYLRDALSLALAGYICLARRRYKAIKRKFEFYEHVQS
jgi:hypothetical protein